MPVDPEAFGAWGKELLLGKAGEDDYTVCGMRIADARLATAALLGALEKLGTYPEGPLLEMHAAAKRMEQAIESWERMRAGGG